ncbi:hypothetical protein [Sphingopyxis witflariensis]|uniref:Secreted protein n=1 Tax=Sphingopyxis witflariensis TaxID=173675 RepID=A0A246K6K7_9SPHN|nr:hypothetical protein [Sphingopyxis witflariensis]OWR00974.1 hypothetical protein CDQ91_00670 [Sphingopyxis witflariensis]
MTRTLISSLFLLSLAACGSGDPAGKSTAKLDAVEVQPGSISDSMIILDNAASDGTAVDNSVPDDGTKKEATKSKDDAADEGEAADETATVDAVAAPAVQKTVTEPAKKGE